MSRESVDLAGQAYAAFNTGGMAAILDFLDPNIEWSEGMDVPEPHVYRDHDGVLRQRQARKRRAERGSAMRTGPMSRLSGRSSHGCARTR